MTMASSYSYIFLLGAFVPLILTEASLNITTTKTDTAINRRSLALAPPLRPPSLAYHGGPIMTGPTLLLHILWYGWFPAAQQSAVMDFVASFIASDVPAPSVSSWWQDTTCRYTDSSNAAAPKALKLGAVATDSNYAAGKALSKSVLPKLIQDNVNSGVLPPTPPNDKDSAIYVVFTAADVMVQDFCMSSCGTHTTATCSDGGGGTTTVAVLWVGNPTQCLGMCAWPYALPTYSPRNSRALRAPNGDPATDGMIINLAALMAGTVTNPFGQGYYPSDLSGPAGMEAATACTGIFGKNSYPGHPGDLRRNRTTGASYNARGVRHRSFLLPAVWSPKTMSCESP